MMTDSSRQVTPIAWTATAVSAIVFWLIAVVALAAAGGFHTAEDEAPLVMGAAIAVPPLFFLALFSGWRDFRDAVLVLDLRLLTAVQAWRVVGALFLVLYAFGHLPAHFALPAGLGDVLVGLMAVWALAALLNSRRNALRRVRAMNYAGLLDFLVAVGTGIATGSTTLGVLEVTPSSDAMAVLPLVLIPTFLVPLFIILHLASLLKLGAKRNASVGMNR